MNSDSYNPIFIEPLQQYLHPTALLKAPNPMQTMKNDIMIGKMSEKQKQILYQLLSSYYNS